MGTTLATLRRNLAARMNFWGGDIQTGLAATTSGASASNTLIDTTRTEPDDEWDSAWIVLNPGSADQVNKPTIWRKVADTGGWVQSSGTLTILGTWPAPYASGVGSGVPYELYKTFRPEQWTQAINYALLESYPHRHRLINAEIPQRASTRIYDYGFLGKQVTSVSNPITAPTVTEVADGTGAFEPGAYTFAYTYFNDFGETLASPTSTTTFTGTNSRAQFSNLTSVPSNVLAANFYASMQPGDTAMDLLDIGSTTLSGVPTNQNFPGGGVYYPGLNWNGTIYSLTFSTPSPYFGAAPPQYNTTVVDFFRLHRIMQRLNPGGYPEIWNDLDPSSWRSLGGTKFMLMYMPVNQFTLKLLMTTQVPTLTGETDITQEPAEMLYWGGEAYLWELITKISQVLNSAWEKLAQSAATKYEILKNQYKMDIPREFRRVPPVRTMY